MLKDGVVLVVISLIVLGGIFVWWTQAPTHSLSAPTEPQVQESQANTKPSPLVVKASPKPKSAPDPVLEPPEVIETAPIPVPVVQRDQRPFPAVEQIATGGHEDSITGKYGDPALSAVNLHWWSYGRDVCLCQGSRSFGHGHPSSGRKGFRGLFSLRADYADRLVSSAPLAQVIA